MFESSRAHQTHKNRRPCFCWFPTLSLNFSRLVNQRARGDLSLSLGALIAVLLATTTVAGGPVYLRSLERVGLAYHFLRTDHAPESALQTCVHLTGYLATGGVREYGVSVASHWDAEVSSVLASTTASPADDPQV